MSIITKGVRAGYDGFHLDNIDLTLRTGSLTALIGPNGCGKSTLLKTIARHIPTGGGSVEIAGRNITRLRTKAVARLVSVLPQHPIVPAGISVEQLVSYGRAPHQNLLGFTSREDRDKVDKALEIVALSDLRDRLVSALSGGQQQRAFIAMCIAQDTPYLLFDEPTSFLDIRYQYEVLDLLARLHQAGKTVVTVLHDITQAARYATDLVVMKDGALWQAGEPSKVITPKMVREVYGIEAHIYPDPISGSLVVTPKPSLGISA